MDMFGMMGKLKDLGNSVLGKTNQHTPCIADCIVLGRFGLSTDNFKFEPNGQGGYSMNFQPSG